jgi:hypothetical protein
MKAGKGWQRVRPELACGLILIALPTLLLWSVTFGGKTLAPVDLLLLMPPWKHLAKERFPEFRRVKAPLLDVVQQYFPWRKFYAEQMRRGELPLWNPFMFCGTSFVGNGMSAIFYPPNLLFIVLPVERAFGWVAWLHLVLAGLFMFGFLRQSVSPLSALTGAITFQLCGFFIAWLAYLPLLCTAVWLPAALWAMEAGRDGKVGNIALAGMALGMALLAGHPQVGFYVLWAFGVYLAWRSLMARSLTPLLWGVAALALGLAFGSVQLLPLLEMARLSFRSGAEGWAAAIANRLPLDQFIRLFVPSFFGDWRSGTHLVWDFARFNFVERTGYPSVIAFLLACLGLSPLVKWLLPLRPFASHPSSDISHSPIGHLPIGHWHIGHLPIGHLPIGHCLLGFVFALVGLLAASVPVVHRFMALNLLGTQAFIGISRALFLFDFGIAMLCAIGVETLKSGERFHWLWLAVPILLMAACLSYGVSQHADIAFHPALRDFTLGQLYQWLILTAIGVTAIIANQWRKGSSSGKSSHSSRRVRRKSSTHSFTRQVSRALPSFLPFLVAADLLSFAWGQHPEAERAMAFFETPSIRWLKRNLGTQRFVAVGTDAIRHWTPSNTLMVYGLRDAQGSDSLMTMRIFRFLQAWDKHSPLHQAFAVRHFASPLLDLMAVRYVLAAVPLSPKERNGLRLVHEGEWWVYENPDALPRAFVVTDWRWANSPDDALRQITCPDFAPHRWAILETLPLSSSLASSLPSSVPSVASRPPSLVPRPFFRDAVNRLEVVARLPQSAALVLADGAYPGWWAWAKGSNGRWQPLTVFIADYAFRAVLLPSGDWRVLWVYFPASVVVGLFLSLVAWGMIVAAVVTQWRKTAERQ